jgi:catechol 2,3-dioxygenase-like lactoylglutathione lyase family enzyme
MGSMELKNVMLGVKDLNASIAFYRDILGLKVAGSVEGEFIFLDAGPGPQLVLRKLGGSANPGMTEFSFQVSDVKAKYAELKSKGITFSQEPRAVTGNKTHDLFATDFRDPDGHILSITSWVPKAPGVST